jgi:hypothetical protein
MRADMTGAARKMHVDEVEINAALVGRLVAVQFPHVGGPPIEPVPNWGTDNALYRLGDDMVVRLPRISRATVTVDKELTFLRDSPRSYRSRSRSRSRSGSPPKAIPSHGRSTHRSRAVPRALTARVR